MDSYEYAQTDREMLAKALADEIKVGEKVTIVKGVFEGRTGEVVRVNVNTNEANVLLRNLRGNFAAVPVTMNLRWIEAVR